MRLTTKGRYGVMAMADIATYSPEGACVNLSSVAERQKISFDYLEQLMVKLRRAGLVISVRGPGGGYKLGHDVEKITIADIVNAVEEPITVTRCIDGDAVVGCVGGAKCITHELWAGLGREITRYLTSITLQDVVAQHNLALAVEVRRLTNEPIVQDKAN